MIIKRTRRRIIAAAVPEPLSSIAARSWKKKKGKKRTARPEILSSPSKTLIEKSGRRCHTA